MIQIKGPRPAVEVPREPGVRAPARPWASDEVETLRRMWANDAPASEIARAIGRGLSRNAVIGKAHRLGLQARPSPIPGRS